MREVWVQTVEKLWGELGNNLLLSSLHYVQCCGLWVSTMVYSRVFRVFQQPFPTAVSVNLPLLVAQFPPLSTTPIKTTTKYINK